MSKFAKDVLDSSAHVCDLTKAFATQLKKGIKAALASFRKKVDTADRQLDVKREEMREDLYL